MVYAFEETTEIVTRQHAVFLFHLFLACRQLRFVVLLLDGDIFLQDDSRLLLVLGLFLDRVCCLLVYWIDCYFEGFCRFRLAFQLLDALFLSYLCYL